MLSFNELKKNLKKDSSGFKKIKIALLSDSASQFLNIAIKGYGIAAQLDFEIFEGDYNQIDFHVFNYSSELYVFNPDFIFINHSSEKLLIDFYKKNPHEKSGFANDTLETYKKYISTIAKQLRSKVIINTLPEINDRVFGNYGAKVNISFVYHIRKINVLLMDLCQVTPDLFVCDLASLQSDLGYNFTFDPKMYINADMVYSIDYLPYIAKNITDIIQSITGSFKKCLILDLDNTLWGGIIGDDGMEGIQVGHFGIGKIFTELQLWFKQLSKRGIILAVCSKNTEVIAIEPFKNHPDMVLNTDDIALFVANWENKVDNIRYIQSVLNIGFDSMVFVDDNPFEREMVKAGIPELSVPDMPDDPAEYLTFLRRLNLFETASHTEEDEQRTILYKEEAKRNQLLHSFENENDFLENLQMLGGVNAFDDFSIPRVAQLTQRSNQFNLRTIRYTEEDIKRITSDSSYLTMALTLEDRFGHHGLIGVIILKKEDDCTLFIDSWIMSCRVLKRGMEDFTLNSIIDLASLYNFEKIAGAYIPTKKNGIVKNHYQDLGFTQEGDRWIINVAGYKQKKTFVNKKSGYEIQSGFNNMEQKF